MTVLSIRPRPKDGLQPLDLFKDTDKISGILRHIEFWGDRTFTGYELYINGRKYDWPNPRAHYVEELVKHIRHCIELDEAFYG